MTGIVELLDKVYAGRSGAGHWQSIKDARDEIVRLRGHLAHREKEIARLERIIVSMNADKEAISESASHYLHEIARLTALLNAVFFASPRQ